MFVKILPFFSVHNHGLLTIFVKKTDESGNQHQTSEKRSFSVLKLTAIEKILSFEQYTPSAHSKSSVPYLNQALPPVNFEKLDDVQFLLFEFVLIIAFYHLLT